MTASTIGNFLGAGLAASRPAAPGLASGVCGFYVATDTSVVSVWNGSSWATVGGGGGGGAVTLVNTQTITAGSEVDFTGLTAGYTYFIVAQDIVASTNAYLQAQFGTGGGPTWDAGGSDYQYSCMEFAGSNGSTGASAMNLSVNALTWAGGGLRLDMHVDPGSTHFHSISGAFAPSQTLFSGINVVNQAITALRLFFSSGTISGAFSLYSVAR